MQARKGGALEDTEKVSGAWRYYDCNHPVARRATPPQLRRGVFSIAPLLDREGRRAERRGGCLLKPVFPQAL